MFFCKERSYKLTPIQELLLALLRAQLWQKSVDDIVLPSSIEEWNALMDLAYKQTVVCFISAACLRHKDIDDIPVEIRKEMQDVIEENKKIHKRHNEVLIELITFFEQHGLHPVLLKGQGIAQMYPEPELRQCGDIDLYFCPNEYELAKKTIEEIEDENIKKHSESYQHCDSRYKGITVELHKHTAWFPNPFVNKRFQRFAQERLNCPSNIIIDGKEIMVPDSLYNMIYVFTHMWNHFEFMGISLRQLSDVAMTLYYNSENVSHDDLNRIVQRFSLVLPWQVSNCVFVERLGLLSNISYFDNKCSRRANLMLGIVFNDGAFNFCKHKDEYEKMSNIRRRIAIHLDAHREFMKVYPVTGNRIWWRYAAVKRLMFYRVLVLLCE